MRYLLEYLVRSGISVPRRIVVDVPTRHLDPDLWSIDTREKSVATLMDLGSVA